MICFDIAVDYLFLFLFTRLIRIKILHKESPKFLNSILGCGYNTSNNVVILRLVETFIYMFLHFGIFSKISILKL